MTVESTTHTVLFGHELDMALLPEQTVVMPVDWPDDGRGVLRPIWREGGMWTDGRTRGPILESDASYLLLHIPTPPLPAVGGQLERNHLDQLPVQAVVRDRYGWTAQLQRIDRVGPIWAGLMTPGDEVTHSQLWSSTSGQLWLIWVPEQRSTQELRKLLSGDLTDEDCIGDGPKEYQR